MPRARILHISDLHERATRESEPWRRRRVLGEPWLRHLDEISEEAPIDLLLFTGDAADRGQPAEFERAAEFLHGTRERLGLSLDRLFVIPGNHDIDRTVEPDSWREVRCALSATADLLAVARWMSGGSTPPGFRNDWRAQVAGRLQAYHRWVANDLGRPELVPGANALGYRATVELPGAPYPIQLIGLNTAWMCGDDSDATKLWILDQQLMQLATDATGKPLSGFRVLMMHHPFEQIADGAKCRRLLQGHADLVLRGHLHDEELETWSDPDHTVRQLAAGCLYEGYYADQWPNACHVITLSGDPSPHEAEVRFRGWSTRGGYWHDDNSLYRGAANGRLLWRFEPPAGPAVNPVVAVDPYRPATPPAFTGRRVLLKKLTAAWAQGRSVSLVGDWRIGKSSVLQTCYESVGKTGRPVSLLSGLGQEGGSPALFVKAVTGVAPTDNSDSAADTLAAWARRNQRPGILPLLLVDECDVLVRRFEYRFFERLRGMLDDLCLGVSSRRELDRVFQDSGKGASPFQNRLELHFIGLLEPDAADKLVETVAGTLPAPTRKSIREWAGRHPFFIQLMTRKLIDAESCGQTLEEAHDEFLAEASSRLRELWNTLGEKEKNLLKEASSIPQPEAAALRRRGLLDEEGKQFGRVLTQWVTEEGG